MLSLMEEKYNFDWWKYRTYCKICYTLSLTEGGRLYWKVNIESLPGYSTYWERRRNFNRIKLKSGSKETGLECTTIPQEYDTYNKYQVQCCKAGTFLVSAQGSFLNPAGSGAGSDSQLKMISSLALKALFKAFNCQKYERSQIQQKVSSLGVSRRLRLCNTVLHTV